VGFFTLRDWYIYTVLLIGIVCLVVSTAFWAKGTVGKPITYRPLLTSDPESVAGQFERGILFFTLPTLLFSLFNITFTVSDYYHRTMRPIHNMARLKAARDGNSSEAPNGKDTMLLDYISTDPVTIVMDSLGAGDYKVTWGVILATACSWSHIVAGRIFAFTQIENASYIMVIVPPNFYASFAILCAYCVAILIARPSKEARSTRPIYTIADSVATFYESDVLKCPEFWVQSRDDTEQHLRSQVTLANREYTYGIYEGQSGQERLGIGLAKTPQAWVQSQSDYVESVEKSIKYAKHVIYEGLYVQDLSDFIDAYGIHGPVASNTVSRVSPEHESGKDQVSRTLRRRRRRDTESGDKHA
jgi:Protein of unknown function (DUF3433)